MKIKAAKAFKILDSRASPTIAVAVKTRKGRFVSGAPSGASVGKHEAEAYRKDVDASVRYFNSRIASELAGFKLKEFEDLGAVEEKAANLYANPTIALEYSLLKALAASRRKYSEIYQVVNSGAKKFPRQLGKAIGGGAHAGAGDIQEYLIAPDTKKFSDAVFINAQLHSYLKDKLAKKDKNFLAAKDDEGGWVTNLPATEILKLLLKAKRHAAKELNCEVDLGVDMAASQFYRKKKYRWDNYSKKQKRRRLNKNSHLDVVSDLMREYKLEYVEDPFDEKDFDSFSELANIKLRKLICADDLTCTNSHLLRKAIKKRSATAVIVKPNQIGSLIKAQEFVDLAKGFGLKVVVSHRSGSLADPVLAHLALAWEADFFKSGIAGGERVAKNNELIRLEQGF